MKRLISATLAALLCFSTVSAQVVSQTVVSPPVATSSILGGVKPDGTTLTNTAGALSVTYGTGANTATQGNDARIPSNFTEGTFTPAITFGGGATGVTYGGATIGSYQRVGTWVTVFARVDLSNKGSSTGAVLITNMPYTAINNGNTNVPCAVAADTLAVTAITMIVAVTVPNTATVAFYFYNTGTLTALADTHVNNTSAFFLSCRYQVV